MNATAHPCGRAPGADEAGHPRRRAILAVVMLGTILGPIDASIVNVILPMITRSFAASVAAAQWIPMAHLLTIASLVLLFGRLGDIWGYRRIFLVGLAGFVTASGLCALAPGHRLAGGVARAARRRRGDDDGGPPRDPDAGVPRVAARPRPRHRRCQHLDRPRGRPSRGGLLAGARHAYAAGALFAALAALCSLVRAGREPLKR